MRACVRSTALVSRNVATFSGGNSRRLELSTGTNKGATPGTAGAINYRAPRKKAARNLRVWRASVCSASSSINQSNSRARELLPTDVMPECI